MTPGLFATSQKDSSHGNTVIHTKTQSMYKTHIRVRIFFL